MKVFCLADGVLEDLKFIDIDEYTDKKLITLHFY